MTVVSQSSFSKPPTDIASGHDHDDVLSSPIGHLLARMIDARSAMMTSDSTGPAPVDEVLLSDLIARVLAAFNAHDAEGFAGVMAEDIVFEHSAAPEPIHGRAQVSAFYVDTIWRAFPDLTLELVDGPFFHPHAPRVSMNWLATGTQTGLLDPPGLAPTGKRATIDVREIAEIRNGLVSRIRIKVDMLDVMRQLGVFPASGSRGERAMAMMQRLQARLSRSAPHPAH
jgi:predicted ester cyclase